MKSIAVLLFLLTLSINAFAKCNSEFDAMMAKVTSVKVFDKNLDPSMISYFSDFNNSANVMNAYSNAGAPFPPGSDNLFESDAFIMGQKTQDIKNQIANLETKISQSSNIVAQCMKTKVSQDCVEKIRELERSSYSFLNFSQSYVTFLNQLVDALSSYGAKFKAASQARKPVPNADEILDVVYPFVNEYQIRDSKRNYLLDALFRNSIHHAQVCTK